jgi:hypothetical protein
MDVLVDGVDCLLFGLKYGVMCQFGFERVKKLSATVLYTSKAV